MSTLTPLNDANFTLPLPIYEAVALGSLQSKDGEQFLMIVGLSKDVVAQLKEKSLDKSDEELQNNTSDYQRFGEGSYEEWYSKNRTPFALIHAKMGQLAALVWFGPKPLGRQSLKYLSEEERAKELLQKEDVWHTLVYRSYMPYRGKGVMGDFVRFCIEKYKEKYPEAKLWTGMSANNAASAGLSARLGFKRRDDLFDVEKNWVAMVLE